LPVSLVDRTGGSRNLDSFRGAPVLVTMFYGSCATACPLITVDLKRIEALLPSATRARVRVLMVSFDQARDTPSALARMTVERGVDPARWTLASASDDDARALAGVLGIKYRKLDNGEFFHSSAIVLIDEAGRPVARLDGLGKDATPIVSALRSPS
jgi:protein SCO1/2